jgi:drug/metabolite transporter (DMT)-like permease
VRAGPSTHQRALLAAAVSGVLVGAAIVATRGVIAQSTPALLALLRYLIGCLCLAPPALIAGRTRIARRDVLPIGVLGIGQFGILIVLLNFGLQRIPAAHGALLFASVPLLTLLLAASLGRERLGALKASGVLLTLVGVALTLGEGALQTGNDAATWLGDLSVLGSAACAAVCSVLYRPYLQRYPALPVSLLAMVAAAMFLAVLAGAEGSLQGVPVFTPGGWLAVGFIGLSSAVGYVCWLWALGHTTPTRVTVFLALSPITATLLGALLLGEPISLPAVLGTLTVSAGLWLTSSG